jgi:hypothetical protein
MAYSNFNKPNLQQPPRIQPYIPPGKYQDIDAKFYTEKKNIKPQVGLSFGRQGRALTPFGSNVNYHSTAFVPKAGGLSQLKVNYGQYLFNQQSGWDSAHPR